MAEAESSMHTEKQLRSSDRKREATHQATQEGAGRTKTPRVTESTSSSTNTPVSFSISQTRLRSSDRQREATHQATQEGASRTKTPRVTKPTSSSTDTPVSFSRSETRLRSSDRKREATHQATQEGASRTKTPRVPKQTSSSTDTPVSFSRFEMKARNRFAHEIMIVVNVFPVMIQRLGERLIDANALHNIVMTKQELLKTLNTREKNILKGLPNGYKNCDMVFLYKMLRISNILKNPKSGYGHKPLSSDISIEDDVERLRILRNELCHRANPEISEEDHELFSQTVISISKRWDKICGSEFAKQIDELLSRDIKEHRIAHYIKKIREEEELKLRQSIDGINIYYGKGIEQQLAGPTDNEDKSSLRVVVKLNSSSDTKHRDIIKKLNKMQGKINVGQQTIELESASSGSIVITATVKWYQIRDHDHFNTELISFIRRSLKAVGKQLKDVCDANIVVVVDNNADYCKESEEKIHDWKGKKKMKLRSDSSKSMKPESNIEWLDHEIAVEGHEDAEKDYILELPNNITEKKLFMIIKKLEKDTSKRSLTVLVKKDDTSANFLKKTDFDFESVRNKEVQIEAAKSVGIIRGPKCTGTGWRVGPDYVITAWHVVKDNTVADSNENDIEDRVQNDTFNIQFHYKEENQFDTSKFKFDKIVFFNDELDTAILKLSCKKRTILPPKIDKFRKIASSDKKELCLVGHPSGKPQTVDSKIQFYQLDVAHLRKVKKYALQHFSDGNTYERMDNTKFILYNCYSTHGSSGSVGIVIEESHKDPVAVLMHLSGYPRNAYNGTLQKAEIQTLKENGNIIEVEQGVKIESIFEAMETTHSDLRREIFGSVNQFQ